jgi:putative ABC transport system permease protein
MAEPATGRLITLPERGRPPLNDVFLRRGRWVDPSRADEVLASEMFCDAHGLNPGDRVAAIINGRRRPLTIVGIALSPEYVYAVRPGELFPDRRTFGIFWMGRAALASAFNMEGGFNDVTLAVDRQESAPAVIAAVDRLIEPYGGLGAVPQRLQISAWTVENELSALQSFGFVLPLIFLGVAAFILNIALTRAMSLQRPQIAALKALGYSNRELAWHYIKWGLGIAAVGAVVGAAGGVWLGSGMITLYNDLFRFPALDYRLSTDVAVQSIFGSLIVAALGAQSAVRRAVSIPPAEAMRPEPPARYRESALERLWRWVRPSHATRMILRNIERQPIRSAVSVLGIAFAVSVLFVMLAFMDVMDVLINEQFFVTMRQDATLSFVEPRSGRARHDIEHLPGVIGIEPIRTVPARLRAGHRTRTLAITALPESPQLGRVVDRDRGVLTLPPDGVVLSKMVGDILGVDSGGTVRIEVLEGTRPVRDVRVASLVDDTLGLQAYMRRDAVQALMREGATITGAAVTLDRARAAEFYRTVKLMPAVAGVALREMTIRNFRETMAANMNLSISMLVFFAGIIAFSVVYNSARVSLSERSRELASLRVLGFTRGEISLILLGELAILTAVALPLGAVIGYGLGQLAMIGFNNEIYRLSFRVSPPTAAWAFLTVMAASFVSGLVVRRRLDRLDLVGVLKTRE